MVKLHFFVVLVFTYELAYPQQSTHPWYDENGVWQGKGRIAISSDGNEHDHDDWAATPFTLAMLAAKGLQDQTTLYTFSDHVWGSNQHHADARQQMLISALEGKKQFGFESTVFIEAVEDPEAAYEAMKNEINKSTKKNPLFIIAAGPMQVIGIAFERANPKKLKFVTIISHSPWNNKHADKPGKREEVHDGWTWAEMETTFKPQGLNMHYIANQNGGKEHDGMRANRRKFDWIKTSAAKHHPAYPEGSWDWLYERQETCVKKGDFDPSDAGMIIYLLLGIEKTDPEHARLIMENPVVRN